MSEAVQSAGDAIRAFRAREGMSLGKLAEKIEELGGEKPSEAKLSRIETGKQPVARDIVKPLEQITGIPAKELRPDLAKLFEAAQ